jgi:hypothetical protein
MAEFKVEVLCFWSNDGTYELFKSRSDIGTGTIDKYAGSSKLFELFKSKPDTGTKNDDKNDAEDMVEEQE